MFSPRSRTHGRILIENLYPSSYLCNFVGHFTVSMYTPTSCASTHPYWYRDNAAPSYRCFVQTISFPTQPQAPPPRINTPPSTPCPSRWLGQATSSPSQHLRYPQHAWQSLRLGAKLVADCQRSIAPSKRLQHKPSKGPKLARTRYRSSDKTIFVAAASFRSESPRQEGFPDLWAWS